MGKNTSMGILRSRNSILSLIKEILHTIRLVEDIAKLYTIGHVDDKKLRINGLIEDKK